MGGVVTDDCGIFMAGFTNYSMGFSLTKVSKGVAILGIKFSSDFGFCNIKNVESDLSVVIYTMVSRSPPLDPLSLIIIDIINYIPLFDVISSRHVPRSCNKVTQYLTKVGIGLSVTSVAIWLEDAYLLIFAISSKLFFVSFNKLFSS